VAFARLGMASWHSVLRWSVRHGRGASMEFPVCWRVSLLPRLDCPRGCYCGCCVVVDLLVVCSLLLGSLILHVRCCAVRAVSLLYSLHCDVVVPSLLVA
jgi:hypothetical protein